MKMTVFEEEVSTMQAVVASSVLSVVVWKKYGLICFVVFVEIYHIAGGIGKWVGGIGQVGRQHLPIRAL